MDRDAKLMRGDGPTVFASVKEGKGVDDVVQLVLAAWRSAGCPGKKASTEMREEMDVASEESDRLNSSWLGQRSTSQGSL
jgi:hypothetical protein